MEMKYCDGDGDENVVLAAVAEHDRGKQLAEVLEKAIYSQVLSYKIDDEESTAAAVISAALNRPHTLALKNTEFTAVAVRKGEIMTLESTAVAKAPQSRKQAGYSPADVGHPDSPQMHWHYHEVGGFYRTYDKEPDPEGEPDPFDRLLWPGSFEDERDQFSHRSSDSNSLDSNDIWGSGRVLWRDDDGMLWNDMCLVGELIDKPPDSDDEPYYRKVNSDWDVAESDAYWREVDTCSFLDPDSDGEY